MTRDMADLSMLELFRMEAGNHTRILESGLPGLSEEIPAEKIQPLIQAANSLKGSARIVGLADAVSLAEAMESALEEGRSGTTSFSPNSSKPYLVLQNFCSPYLKLRQSRWTAGWKKIMLILTTCSAALKTGMK